MSGIVIVVKDATIQLLLTEQKLGAPMFHLLTLKPPGLNLMHFANSSPL
jgi:hypothetical protein